VQFSVEFTGKDPQASGLVFGDPTDPTEPAQQSRLNNSSLWGT
jgi:hypothetical protein